MQSDSGLAVDPVCLNAIVVSENREAPGVSNRPKDEFSKFLFVVSGTARWVCDRRRYMLGPTTLCHLPAGLEVHQEVMPNQEVLAYTIRYRPELLSPSLVSHLAGFGFVPMDLGCTTINQARLVRSIFQEMLFEQDSRQEGWELILRSRLIDLAVRTLRLVRRKWGEISIRISARQ